MPWALAISSRITPIRIIVRALVWIIRGTPLMLQLFVVFYVPSFICGTLIGGSIAYVFLKKLAGAGLLKKFQNMLSTKAYDDNSGVLGSAAAIAAFGVIVYLVISILTSIFNVGSTLWTVIAFSSMGAFILAGVVYYVVKTIHGRSNVPASAADTEAQPKA